MNAGKSHPKNVDAVIVSVLIDTEHPALLATFGIEPFSQPDRSDNDINVWYTQLERLEDEPLSIALTCLGGGGTANALMRTKTILEFVDTKSIYLVGSAIGRKDRTSICDLVVSSEGIMNYQGGRPGAGGIGRKPKYVYPDSSTKNKVEWFHTARMKFLGWEDEYKSILDKCKQYKIPVFMPSSEPEVHFDTIASGDALLDEQILNAICDRDDSVRAGEMEGYGFAQACENSRIDWLVIRGVSDFGRREDKEKWKTTATVMASSFLKIYLKKPFQSPRQIKKLTQDSIYVRDKIPDIVRQVLREKSLDVTPVKFSLDLTISDLERFCHILHPARPFEEVRKMVRDARATAFQEKYADRTEEDDERFLDIEQWKTEFRNLLIHLGILDLSKERVISVGIGNCLEADGLFDAIERFVGVDISPKALDKAKERCPRMQLAVNDAEDLQGIENSSQDVYISLRTYQSTLFDIDTALLEAYRVLRPGGMIVISIPHIFIDKNKEKIKGLLLPESDEVDPDLPYMFVDNIRRRLNLLNFDNIGIRTGIVEVYIYGQRG